MNNETLNMLIEKNSLNDSSVYLIVYSYSFSFKNLIDKFLVLWNQMTPFQEKVS